MPLPGWRSRPWRCADLDHAPLTPDERATLRELTVRQMQLRIEMRNAQFGHPVPGEALERLRAGDCEPMAFDWSRAGIEPPAA